MNKKSTAPTRPGRRTSRLINFFVWIIWRISGLTDESSLAKLKVMKSLLTLGVRVPGFERARNASKNGDVSSCMVGGVGPAVAWVRAGVHIAILLSA